MQAPEQLPQWVASSRSLRPFWMDQGANDLDVGRYFLGDGSRPVISVRVIANEVLGTGQDGQSTVPMAHFRILLVLNEGTSDGKAASVELSSRQTTKRKTTLCISSRNWVVSRRRTGNLSDRAIPSVPGMALTVDDILNHLILNRRHRYTLHHSGSGCRYWTKRVLRDLVNIGLLAPGSDNIVASSMEPEIAQTRPDIAMLPQAEGTFS